ncbi:MAG: GNAT family N-acetyltransferase [Hyphomicrobiales bacterium]|nr:GNAT family N-acetyltransferase [Hyphomicrobiales bacterium]
MTEIEITPADAADAEAIAAVHVASWETTYRGLVPATLLAGMTLERRVTQWRMRLDAVDGGRFVRVARRFDGEIVGMVQAGSARTVGDFAEWELDVLYVLDRHHGAGVGRRLMTAAVEEARAKGAASLGLWVVAGNVRAFAFYRRGGAVVVTERVAGEVTESFLEHGLRIDLARR